jgi:hypothetical protein
MVIPRLDDFKGNAVALWLDDIATLFGPDADGVEV